MDTCKSCQHALDSHVRAVKDLPDELIDRILFLVYDMDNILLQMRNEKKDQDLRKTYNFLFQFLKKNMLQPTLLSLAREKFGVPPFGKPSIEKVHVPGLHLGGVARACAFTEYGLVHETRHSGGRGGGVGGWVFGGCGWGCLVGSWFV